MKLLYLFPLLLCFGCALMHGPVPANVIRITSRDGATYSISTPKNVTIKQFEASFDTNGIPRIKFDSWSSTNDPYVIDAAGAARVAEWNAISGLINSGIEAGIKAAAKGAAP